VGSSPFDCPFFPFHFPRYFAFLQVFCRKTHWNICFEVFVQRTFLIQSP